MLFKQKAGSLKNEAAFLEWKQVAARRLRALGRHTTQGRLKSPTAKWVRMLSADPPTPPDDADEQAYTFGYGFETKKAWRQHVGHKLKKCSSDYDLEGLRDDDDQELGLVLREAILECSNMLSGRRASSSLLNMVERTLFRPRYWRMPFNLRQGEAH